MLSKQNRLRKQKEFNFVYRKGNIIKSDIFNIYHTYTKLKNPKFGIVVNKKVGNSVIRSRVKRLISESIRLNIEKIKLNNYIIVAKENIISKTLDDITSQLFKSLEKESLLK